MRSGSCAEYVLSYVYAAFFFLSDNLLTALFSLLLSAGRPAVHGHHGQRRPRAAIPGPSRERDGARFPEEAAATVRHQAATR